VTKTVGTGTAFRACRTSAITPTTLTEPRPVPNSTRLPTGFFPWNAAFAKDSDKIAEGTAAISEPNRSVPATTVAPRLEMKPGVARQTMAPGNELPSFMVDSGSVPAIGTPVEAPAESTPGSIRTRVRISNCCRKRSREVGNPSLGNLMSSTSPEAAQACRRVPAALSAPRVARDGSARSPSPLLATAG